MPGKRIRHATAAVVIMIILTLAAPAQAGGWTAAWNPGTDVWQTAWAWLAKLWPGAPAGGRTAERGAHGIVKSSTDPGGPSASTSSTPPCETNCERGGAIDPDG